MCLFFSTGSTFAAHHFAAIVQAMLKHVSHSTLEMYCNPLLEVYFVAALMITVYGWQLVQKSPTSQHW